MCAPLFSTYSTIFFLTGVGGKLLDSFNIPRAKSNVQASLVTYTLQETTTQTFSICVYFRPDYQVNQEDMVLFDTGSESNLIRAGLFKDGMGGWVEVGDEYLALEFLEGIKPRQWSSLCISQGLLERKVWLGEKEVMRKQIPAGTKIQLSTPFHLGSEAQGVQRFAGELAGPMLWPSELSKDGLEAIVFCQPPLHQSLLSSPQASSGVEKRETNQTSICSAKNATTFKLFNKTRKWSDAMALCSNLGGSTSLTSRWQLAQEIKVEKTICQLVWLPIFYNISTETWITHEGKVVDVFRILGVIDPSKQKSSRNHCFSIFTQPMIIRFGLIYRQSGRVESHLLSSVFSSIGQATGSACKGWPSTPTPTSTSKSTSMST